MDHKNNSLLWELSSPISDESSYLFATIHLPDNSLFHRISQVKSLIDSCDSFIAEYDLDETDEKLQQVIMFEGSGGLKDLIPAKKYIKLQRQIKKSFGLDINQYNFMKPMIIEQMITSTLVEKLSHNPMDMQLWEYAKKNEKHLLGAESYQSQIDIMKAFELDKQVQQLMSISRNPKSFRRRINKLKRYYQEENIAALYKGSMKGIGKMKRILVYDRNVKMADMLHQKISDASFVCAVGAGHLAGYKGLLRLLKLRGFKLKAM